MAEARKKNHLWLILIILAAIAGVLLLFSILGIDMIPDMPNTTNRREPERAATTNPGSPEQLDEGEETTSENPAEGESLAGPPRPNRREAEELNERYRQRRAERQREESLDDPFYGQNGDTRRVEVTHGCSSESQHCFDFPDGDYPRGRARRIVQFISREIGRPGTHEVPEELVQWEYTNLVPNTGCTGLRSGGQVCWSPNPNYQNSEP